MKKLSIFAGVIFVLMALSPSANSQSVSGQITGTVADSADAVVVGATVKLTSDLNQQIREYKTDGNGSFQFPNILPGSYQLRISYAGFKSYQQSKILVSAQERVDLHTIHMEVGDVASSIEVASAAAHVATDSSDRATNINLQQIENTPIRGRDYRALIKTLPGVQDLNTHDSRGWGSGVPTVNGGQMGQVLVTLDGIGSQDSGAPGLNTYLSPSVDAIAEVKLLVSNYTAEYGARNGGQMNVTIKNGTNQFHGSAYYYWRHEQLNANEFFNNKLGVVKPIYRYQNPGGTFGGPLLIPGTRFNKDRTKLFFFFSYDYLHNVGVTPINQFTMPTALERAGDFSQSLNTNGSPILIRDPLTNASCSATSSAGCFPNNKIPASRFNPIGQAQLNLFPLPNSNDPTGQRQFNSQFQLKNTNPREDKILRVDYNIGKRDTMFVRLIQDYQDQSGFGAILGAQGDPWGQFPHSYNIPSAGAVVTEIHTFSPTLINEATYGINRAHQQNVPTEEASFKASQLPLKDSSGKPLTLPNIFGANSLNLLPAVNFGLPSGFTAQSAPAGLPRLPAFGFDSRWPFDGTDDLQNFTDNVTWIKGRHSMKFGVYYETMARNVSVYSTYNTAGTYYYGSDIGNPVDTGNPFSNALTGNLYAYGEDNKKQINYSRYKQFEWYLQDTWRINRRLTLDVGLRFQYLGSVTSEGATLGIFNTPSYSDAKAGQLLLPTLINGNKASINPVNGNTFPYARQGTFDPSTYAAGGVPFSGIDQYKSSLFKDPPIQLGPRIGLAWDVFGNGKTAFRTGFGSFYGRAFGVDTIGASGVGTGPIAAPPSYQAPIILNTTINSLIGSQGFFTPQNTNGGSRDYLPPVTYNWSAGIQHDLGRGYILDVAYVGNRALRQWNQGSVDFNAVKPLTTWTPTAGPGGTPGPVAKFLDPTSSNGGTGGFYSTNLVRSLSGGYRGWGSINMFTQINNSFYDALQASANKRFGSNLQFGANYTWSKTLSYNRAQWVNDSLTKNIAGGNRPHAVNLNWSYTAPTLSRRLMNNGFGKQLLDGWNVAGNATFYNGLPLTPTCNNPVSAPIGHWTGTPTGGLPFRCQMNGSLWLPEGATPESVSSKADPRLWYPFAGKNFVLPSVNSLGIGNTPPTLTYGPGVQSIDLSVYKVFTVREGKSLMIKGEAFNVMNHFNPGNPDMNQTLNFATGQNTNANFGTITGASIQSRRMVLSARFRF